MKKRDCIYFEEERWYSFEDDSYDKSYETLECCAVKQSYDFDCQECEHYKARKNPFKDFLDSLGL